MRLVLLGGGVEELSPRECRRSCWKGLWWSREQGEPGLEWTGLRRGTCEGLLTGAPAGPPSGVAPDILSPALVRADKRAKGNVPWVPAVTTVLCHSDTQAQTSHTFRGKSADTRAEALDMDVWTHTDPCVCGRTRARTHRQGYSRIAGDPHSARTQHRQQHTRAHTCTHVTPCAPHAPSDTHTALCSPLLSVPRK